MSISLKAVVTLAGMALAASASPPGILLPLTHISFGGGAWNPDDTATALQDQYIKVAMAGGQMVQPQQARLQAYWTASSGTYPIREVGIWSNTTLVALYSICGSQGTLSTPPGSPAIGDTWTVGTTPTGAWAAFTVGHLAVWNGMAWYDSGTAGVTTLNTPPGSPALNDTYDVGSAPTGAWSAFTTGNFAVWNGTAWVQVTVPAFGYKTPRIDFVFFYDVLFSTIPANTLTVVADTSQSAILNALAQHINIGDAHPMYARLDLMAQHWAGVMVPKGAPTGKAQTLAGYTFGSRLPLGTLSTPPGSPATWDTWTVGPSPTGAWSAFTVGHQVVWNGAAWIDTGMGGRTSLGTLSTPPGGPAEGDTYTMGLSPTGAWANIPTGHLATFEGGQWYDAGLPTVLEQDGNTGLFCEGGTPTSGSKLGFRINGTLVFQINPDGSFAAAQQATTSLQGIIQLATQLEVNTGTDPNKAVTPATLAGLLAQGWVVYSDTDTYSYNGSVDVIATKPKVMIILSGSGGGGGGGQIGWHDGYGAGSGGAGGGSGAVVVGIFDDIAVGSHIVGSLLGGGSAGYSGSLGGSGGDTVSGGDGYESECSFTRSNGVDGTTGIMIAAGGFGGAGAVGPDQPAPAIAYQDPSDDNAGWIGGNTNVWSTISRLQVNAITETVRASNGHHPPGGAPGGDGGTGGIRVGTVGAAGGTGGSGGNGANGVNGGGGGGGGGGNENPTEQYGGNAGAGGPGYIRIIFFE